MCWRWSGGARPGAREAGGLWRARPGGGALQWRLSGLEAALQAPEPRQAALLEEARPLLAVRFPAQAARLHQAREELGGRSGALWPARLRPVARSGGGGRTPAALSARPRRLPGLAGARPRDGGGGEGPLPRSLEEADALLAPTRRPRRKWTSERRTTRASWRPARRCWRATARSWARAWHSTSGCHTSNLVGTSCSVCVEARREALVQAHVYQLVCATYARQCSGATHQVPASGWHGGGLRPQGVSD